jgi:hypothetical protein
MSQSTLSSNVTSDRIGPRMIESANQSLVADWSFALASLALGRRPKRAIGRPMQPRTISMALVGHLFP